MACCFCSKTKHLKKQNKFWWGKMNDSRNMLTLRVERESWQQMWTHTSGWSQTEAGGEQLRVCFRGSGLVWHKAIGNLTVGQRREPEIITHCSTVEPIHIQLSVIILPDAFTCAWKLTSSSRSTTGPNAAFNLFWKCTHVHCFLGNDKM